MTGWNSKLVTAFGFRNSVASQGFGKGLIPDMLTVLDLGYFFLLRPGLPPASLPPASQAGSLDQCRGPGAVPSRVHTWSSVLYAYCRPLVNTHSLERVLCKGSLMGP